MKKQGRITDRVSGYAWMNFGLVAVFLLSTFIANGQSRIRANVEENTQVEIYRSLEDLLNDRADKTIEAD